MMTDQRFTISTSPSGASPWMRLGRSRSFRLKIFRRVEKGLRYVYANGVEVIHGDQYEPGKNVNGVAFIGSTGKIFVNRAFLASDPVGIIKEPLGEKDVHLFKSPGHQLHLAELFRLGARLPFATSRPLLLGDGLSSWQSGVLEPQEAALGSKPLAVRQRRGGRQVARPRAARPLAATRR